jgi:hypothetical protein
MARRHTINDSASAASTTVTNAELADPPNRVANFLMTDVPAGEPLPQRRIREFGEYTSECTVGPAALVNEAAAAPF